MILGLVFSLAPAPQAALADNGKITVWDGNDPREVTGVTGEAGSTSFRMTLLTDDTGEPVAGATATVTSNMGLVTNPVTSGEDGVLQFSIDSSENDLTDIYLDLPADAASLLLPKWIQISDLSFGYSYDLGDVEVNRGGLLSGSLRLATGATAGSSEVVVLDLEGGWAAEAAVELAPGQPTAWETLVQPGSYKLAFSRGHDDFPARYWRDATSIEAAEVIDVVAGARIAGLDGTLTAHTSSISGRVTDQAGRPMAEVAVSAYGATGGKSVSTDAAGNYLIRNVAPDSYTVSFDPRDDIAVWQYYDGVREWDDATRVVIPVAGANITGIDAVLESGAWVTGTIPEQFRSQVSSLRLLAVEGGAEESAWPKGDGSFSFGAVPAGTYQLVVGLELAGSYLEQQWGTPFILASGETHVIDLAGFSPRYAELSVIVEGASGGAVSILTPEGGFLAGRTVSEDGVAEFLLPEGDAVVTYTDEFDQTIYYGGTDLSSATMVRLEAGSPQSITMAAPGGRISGTVTDEDGEPVEGAVVELFTASDLYGEIGSQTSDAAGGYSFKGLSANNYAVRAAGGETLHLSTWFGPSGQSSDATPIVLEPDALADGIDIAMPLGGGISGSVTGPEGDYHVNVWSTQHVGGATVHLDGETSGDWEFLRLAEGAYLVTVESSAGGTQSIEVEVLKGAVATGTDFTFEEVPAQITGTVTLLGTQETIPASIEACPADQGAGLGCVWARAELGEYSLSGLEPGASYYLYFSRSYASSSYLPRWWPNAATREEATPVTVPEEGGAAIVADIALAQGTTVTGRVIDSVSGEPVSGVSVSSHGADYSYGYTDYEGEFTLPVLTPGEVEITTSGSWRHLPASTELTVPAAGLSGVEISLARGYVISGNLVADNLGVPLGSIWIDVLDASGGQGAYGYTDRSGRYTTQSALPPGEYLVRFQNYDGLYVEQWYDGGAERQDATPVAIVDGDVTGIDGRLTLGGAVRGSIVDQDGTPVAGARIGLARAPESEAGLAAQSRLTPQAAGDPGEVLLGVETHSNADGSFELPPVDPGRYSLYYYTGQHATQWHDGKDTWEVSDVINVSAGRTVVLGESILEDLADGEVALLPEQSLSNTFQVIQNPADARVSEGESASFTAIASGVPLPTVQWQVLEGDAWQDLPGEEGLELILPARALTDSGRQYRAVFTQGASALQSMPATLTVEARPEVPGVSGTPTATPGITSVDLAWTAPESNGGAAITGYELNIYKAGEATPVRTVPLGAVLTATIGGLEQGTSYEVTVTAVNAVGRGAASAVTSFTTSVISVPTAPFAVEATPVSPTQVSLKWVEPEADGGAPVTGYTVEVRADGQVVTGAQVAITGTTARVTGLTPETAYSFVVAAVNSAGQGTFSAPASAATPAEPPPVTVPGAPAAPLAKAIGPGELTVTWAAPGADGNSPIVGYALRVHSAGEHIPALDQEVAGDQLEATIRGLTAETGYRVQVAARNAVGYGEFSPLSEEWVTPAPVTVPGVPAVPTLTDATQTQLRVSWAAPESDGGSAITGYRVELSDAGGSVRQLTIAAVETSTLVAGLEPGVSYRARVAAVNPVGAGEFSGWSQPIATPKVEEPVDPEPSPKPSPSVSPKPSPSVSPTPSPSASPKPSPSASPKPSPSASGGGTGRPTDGSWIYITPGKHSVNGREWFTRCEPYSQTVRCTTEIWASVIVVEGGSYVQKSGWAFNNMTYLPRMKRSQWQSNPLGVTGQWTAPDGRSWKTECDTAQTGRNGCRSYAKADVIERTAAGYRVVNRWVFNNMVRFS